MQADYNTLMAAAKKDYEATLKKPKLIGSPLSKAADILFPVISDSIRQQALPAYSQHISVESTQFSNQGTMAGAALVKDAMYNGLLLPQ